MTEMVAVKDVIAALDGLREQFRLAEQTAEKEHQWYRVSFEKARQATVSDAIHEVKMLAIVKAVR